MVSMIIRRHRRAVKAQVGRIVQRPRDVALMLGSCQDRAADLCGQTDLLIDDLPAITFHVTARKVDKRTPRTVRHAQLPGGSKLIANLETGLAGQDEAGLQKIEEDFLKALGGAGDDNDRLRALQDGDYVRNVISAPLQRIAKHQHHGD